MSEEQSELFDAKEGRRRRDAGIEKAMRAAPSTYKEAALFAAREASERFPEITTDEVELMLDAATFEEPPSKFSLGGVMKIAARLGYIEKTNRVRPSNLPACNRRPKTVWRSKRFRGVMR